MPKHNEEPSLHKIPATSRDVRKEMLEKIRGIYPALFGEGNSLDAKELQALVEDYSKPEVERYTFPWAGKTASKRFAFTPSKARLVPDKKRSVDFDTTQNLIIEGENLEVLKLLQASYFKKVKMIYIDPPYNTGHDFVYPDDYSESKQAYWEKNGIFHDGVRMDTNTESSGRYHSNWLSMMQSRLLLARNLLRDDGVIFVSIDDNEVHNLRKLMDEIFGEENFISDIIWEKRFTRSNNAKLFATSTEYIILYRKSDTLTDLKEPRNSKSDAIYANPDNDPRGSWTSVSYVNPASKTERPNLFYPIFNPITKKYIKHPTNAWKYEKETHDVHVKEGKLYWGKKGENQYPRLKKFLSEMEGGMVPDNLWGYEDVGTTDEGTKELVDLMGCKTFDFPKPHRLLEKALSISSSQDDLILDFFAGSGTTGHAVMRLNQEDGGNRKFILVQLPEAIDEKSEAYKAGYQTISQITIERVKRAGVKIKKEKSEVDIGFKVLRLAKSLFPQNLFEIDPDMTEKQKVKAWEEYLEKSKQAHLFDFKPDELLVEIALKDGFDLNFKAEPVKGFKKNKVLDVSDGAKTALVCLDENIQEDTIKDLESYKERRFICLERAVNSTRKWNLKRMFGDNLWVA
jgi:adenine-specific DNA-methyltransferase